MGRSLFQRFIGLVIGLSLLIPFGYRLYTYSVFNYRSVAVDGIVVKSLRGRDLGGRAIIEYRDLDGNAHEIASKYKIHWLSAPKKRERVAVRFLPDEPDNAIVESLFHYVVVPLFCVAIGGGLIVSMVKRDCGDKAGAG
jgi:hypothetical protein